MFGQSIALLYNYWQEDNYLIQIISNSIYWWYKKTQVSFLFKWLKIQKKFKYLFSKNGKIAYDNLKRRKIDYEYIIKK